LKRERFIGLIKVRGKGLKNRIVEWWRQEHSPLRGQADVFCREVTPDSTG